MGIIKKPIITEKYSQLNEKGIYAFEVVGSANKVQIRQEVEAKYGVTVLKVNTINIRPDRKTRYTKSGMQSGMKSGMKKAVVYLPEGEYIDYYEDI